jgi:hypothetical protein
VQEAYWSNPCLEAVAIGNLQGHVLSGTSHDDRPGPVRAGRPRGPLGETRVS